MSHAPISLRLRGIPGETVLPHLFAALRGLCTIFAFVFLASQPIVRAQSAEVVVVTGDSPPDGDGSFSLFSDPIINDFGQTAFKASLTETSNDSGIFRGGAALAEIARDGHPSPLRGWTFTSFRSEPALNNSGQVAFVGKMGTVAAALPGRGNSLSAIVYNDERSPDGSGQFWYFSWVGFVDSMNQVIFDATLANTTGGSADDRGLFRGNAAGLSKIIRRGNAPRRQRQICVPRRMGFQPVRARHRPYGTQRHIPR